MTPNRQALLAQVHIGRKELCLDEDVYRALLERLTGQRSAKDLNERALGSVVTELKRLGWKPKSGSRPKRSANPQARKIWAMWSDLCKRKAVKVPTRAALRSLCKRLTGTEDPDWL